MVSTKDAISGKLIRTINPNVKDVSCLALSPSGRYLATGSSVVSVFDLATGRKIPRESWHGASITCIHGSADETICSGGKDGTVVFSTPGSREHKLAQAHKGRVSAVDW